MNAVTIAENLRQKCPDLRLALLAFKITANPKNGTELWNEIAKIQKVITQKYTLDDVKNIPPIASARIAYKACGKAPARYRLSAEALTRRVLRGKDLYKVGNTVDYINLLSLASGFSIGGYDAEKIKGNIEMGIGGANEPYQAIGRGELNIADMPVFRDEQGAFGSATSDSLRTMITQNTRKALLIVVDFGGDSPQLKQLLQLAEKWLPLADGIGNMNMEMVL